ncbi:MAG TPA: serine/threonine protein phosphatase, partial [Ruminococcus sp.]|nr:serine/threonine protein phosphatase [Ruminococcus sp.]
MIYVVGDLHGDLSKIKKLHEDKKLSKSDTVILLGDTGLSSLPNNPP